MLNSFLVHVPRNSRWWRWLVQLADWCRQWPWIYPRGIEASARKWLTRSQNRTEWYASLRGDWYQEANPGGLSIHPPPAELPAVARRHFRQVATLRYPPSAVFHFAGASLVSNEGLVLTRDNRVLAEFSHYFNTRTLRAAIRSRPFPLVKTHVARVDESVGLLAAPQGWNYYHWIFDVLPRLGLLDQWRGVIEKYAIPDRLSAAQIESLRLLGVSESQLLRLQPDTRLRCERLYAPSLPGSEGCYPPWSLAYLRSTFLPHAVRTPGRGPLIYIVRGPAAQRPILNETELIACLERRGFSPVRLETYGFLEQVAIFRDAQVVVAAHGAGLANLVFSSRTALLELFSADYLRPDCYFTLARQAAHPYDCWVDQSPAGAGRPWGAISVPLDVIESKVTQLRTLVERGP